MSCCLVLLPSVDFMEISYRKTQISRIKLGIVTEEKIKEMMNAVGTWHSAGRQGGEQSWGYGP